MVPRSHDELDAELTALARLIDQERKDWNHSSEAPALRALVSRAMAVYEGIAAYDRNWWAAAGGASPFDAGHAARVKALYGRWLECLRETSKLSRTLQLDVEDPLQLSPEEREAWCRAFFASTVNIDQLAASLAQLRNGSASPTNRSGRSRLAGRNDP